MDISSINWLAVLVSTLVFYGLGAFWYAPPVFGKAWMKAIGMDKDSAKKDVNMTKLFITTFILSLIMVVNLAFFLSDASIGAGEGALYGFLTGFGWVAMSIALTALYEQRSLSYILINSGYLTVGFTVVGFILGAWK